MRRRTFLGFGAAAGLGACAIREATLGNRYYSGPVSDHFDGTAFFNPGGDPPRGLREAIRWQMEMARATWPRSVPVVPTRPDPDVAGLRATLVGHATVLIQAGGRNLLVDPIWSERASPVSFAGPRRVVAPGVPFEALPRIDAVLVSHNHYDHMDASTLRRLHAAHGMPVLTCLGNDAILREAVPGIDARAGDWGDVLEGGGLSVRLLPAHHWSQRGTRDRCHALWCSFAVETPAGRVLASGDTAYGDGRPYAAAAAHGPYRLATIPIGAYAPRWYMNPQHQDPAQAVAGFEASGAAHAMAMHWGAFQMTDEPRDEPPRLLREALDARGIPRGRFRVMLPGEAWDVPEG